MWHVFFLFCLFYSCMIFSEDNVLNIKDPFSQTKIMNEHVEKDVQREKISLDFQDIGVREVLQLFADFTGLNIIISDSVTGNLTVKLVNVPWEQALDFILKAKGLRKFKQNNLLFVSSNAEVLLKDQQEENSIPLQTKLFTVHYTKAKDLELLLQNTAMLSQRGMIKVDSRTNTLLVQDIEARLQNIKQLIVKLDVPVRQILINAQVVQTKDDLVKKFGLKVGFEREHRKGSFAVSKLPGGSILDLELKASELEDKSKILARPKLLTLEQQTATIETGTDIPYTSISQKGASPNVIFKKAVLKLEVKPQIMPNEKILLELTITKDHPGSDYFGQTGIDTTNLKTMILVNNGETAVLGGIFAEDLSNKVEKVPVLSRIPVFGNLFKDSITGQKKKEVLIFVTPSIVKNEL